jgi:hypothetical protein
VDRLYDQLAQSPEGRKALPILHSLRLEQVQGVGGGDTFTENLGKQVLVVEGGNALQALVAPAAPLAAVVYPFFEKAWEEERKGSDQSPVGKREEEGDQEEKE